MNDEAAPKKVPPFDLADVDDRVAARMRRLRKACPSLGWQELLKKAFSK